MFTDKIHVTLNIETYTYKLNLIGLKQIDSKITTSNNIYLLLNAYTTNSMASSAYMHSDDVEYLGTAFNIFCTFLI